MYKYDELARINRALQDQIIDLREELDEKDRSIEEVQKLQELLGIALDRLDQEKENGK